MSTQEPGFDWFAQPAARQNLTRKSVQGTLWSAASRGGNQLIRVASLLILARLLMPGDFGLIGMTMAVVGIIAVFQDLGFSGAIIQRPSITHQQVSNLFWLNVAASLVGAALVVGAAPLLQRYYGDPRVAELTRWLALGFCFNGAASQHRALLGRTLQMRALASISLASTAVTAAVSLVGAWLGAGYWALAGGLIAGNLVSVGLSWMLCGWRPTRPRRGAGTRAMISFGVNVALFTLMGYVAKNLYNFVIGRQWGAVEVGVYGRAAAVSQQLLGNVVQPVGQVGPSALSRLALEPEKFREYYYRACTLVVIVALPVAFVGLVLPHEFVLVVLGDRWQASAPLLQVLSWGVLAQALSHTTGWVFVSTGRPATMLAWGIFGWSVIIVGTFVGAAYGLHGIAAAASICAGALLVPNLWIAYAGTPLTLTALAQALARPLLAGVLASAVAWGGLLGLQVSGPWIRLLLGGTVFLAAYAALLLLLGQAPLLREILAQLRRRPVPE